ncbi:MAG: HAMP domain-containing histidine kinase, partial [Verrucomicrobiales bacterium]|nr:HAMP domain-containing histidine kinase [Verrucomicrobiales bacterium]
LDLLLKSSRSEGDPNLTMQPYPVELLLDAVRREHADGPNLDFEIDSHLPNVLADPFQVNLVFENLISNAERYQLEGSPVTVKAAKSADGNFVRFSILDRGRGVAEEDQDRIFERFFRVNENSRRAGLGLWVSREIIRAHHGRIGVESSPDESTEFFFELPLSS